MNNVTLVGRLGRDPELKTTQSGVEFCSFSIAVDRRFKSATGERESDWINIKCWRQTATFVSQYFKKGMKIGIIGSIQTGSYEKDGITVYTTDVVADQAYFIESKRDGSGYQTGEHSPQTYNSTAVSTELPFTL